MKALKIVFAFALAVLWAGAALAQDPVKVDAKHYKVLVDNPSVRVLKITYPAGDKSVMHQHPDAMVVPLVSSKVAFTTPDGKTQEQELPNESASVHAGRDSQPGERRLGADRRDPRRVQGRCARHGDRAYESSWVGNKDPFRKPAGDRLSFDSGCSLQRAGRHEA